MSTPFPPNNKLKGISAYAPARVRDRTLSQDPDESAATPTQPEAAPSQQPEEIEHDPVRAAEDARPEAEAGAANDALDWVDDAIREIVALNHASDSQAETDPPVCASHSPSITPTHDESTCSAPSEARRRHNAGSRNTRPRPPRLETLVVPPPPAGRKTGRPGQILQMSLAIAFAAIVAYGVTAFHPSQPGAPRPKVSGTRVAAAPPQRTETPAAPLPASRLVVGDQQAFANEPVSLALTVEHALADESLLLDRLAQGTTLSAGMSISPSSWQLPPDKLAGLYLYAPKDFVGVMNTVVELLDPGKRLLDSRAMQLKWISKPPQPALQPAVASAANKVPPRGRIDAAPPDVPAAKPIDPGEAALLMRRGRDFLASGDISAARVAFGRLAVAGMPDAALALANTYDPTYLAAHNVIGVLGDRARALTLYRRARDLGSLEADRILASRGANSSSAPARAAR